MCLRSKGLYLQGSRLWSGQQCVRRSCTPLVTPDAAEGSWHELRAMIMRSELDKADCCWHAHTQGSPLTTRECFLVLPHAHQDRQCHGATGMVLAKEDLGHALCFDDLCVT